MLNIAHINIAKPSDTSELPALFTAAFIDAFGWSEAEDGYLYGGDDRSIGVKFTISGSNLYCYVMTSGDGGSTSYSTYVSTSLSTFFLNYTKSTSGDTIAFSMDSSASDGLGTVIAQDAAGDKIAFSTTYGFGNGYSVQLSSTLLSNINANTVFCTSICKLPNFFANVMTKELYMVLSVPSNSGLASMLMLVDGKYYRPVIGGKLAILVS